MIVSAFIVLKWILTLRVPEKLPLYGLYVYVVHIYDFGMLKVI